MYFLFLALIVLVCYSAVSLYILMRLIKLEPTQVEDDRFRTITKRMLKQGFESRTKIIVLTTRLDLMDNKLRSKMDHSATAYIYTSSR